MTSSAISYLDYLSQQSPWARGYIERESVQESGVFVSKQYMRICDGNAVDAMLLSQIIYWSSVSPKTGQPRTQYQREDDDGICHWWVVKTYEEWQDELAFKSIKVVRDSIGRLEKLGIIHRKVIQSPFHVTKATAIRINWRSLGDLLHNDREVQHKEQVTKKSFASDQKGSLQVTKKSFASDQKVVSIYTETISETTQENKTISSDEEINADVHQQSAPPQKAKTPSKKNASRKAKPKSADPNKPAYQELVTAIETEMIKCGKWKKGSITASNYKEAGSLAKELIALEDPVWPKDIPSYFEWVLEQEWSSWTLHALKKHVSDWREWEDDDYVQPPPANPPGVTAPDVPLPEPPKPAEDDEFVGPEAIWAILDAAAEEVKNRGKF